MASRPLASWPAQPASAPARPRLRAVESGVTFSDLEWSIVALAENDGLASLRQPNRFWNLVGAIFGIWTPNRLASDRLEALRRVAVLVWRGPQSLPKDELQPFFEAGFKPSHLEQLQRRIASVRMRVVGGAAR